MHTVTTTKLLPVTYCYNNKIILHRVQIISQTLEVVKTQAIILTEQFPNNYCTWGNFGRGKIGKFGEMWAIRQISSPLAFACMVRQNFPLSNIFCVRYIVFNSSQYFSITHYHDPIPKYTGTYVHTHAHTHTHVHTHIHTHTHIPTYTHAHTYLHTRTYLPTHTHARTHTHTNIHHWHVTKTLTL